MSLFLHIDHGLHIFHWRSLFPFHAISNQVNWQWSYIHFLHETSNNLDFFWIHCFPRPIFFSFQSWLWITGHSYNDHNSPNWVAFSNVKCKTHTRVSWFQGLQGWSMLIFLKLRMHLTKWKFWLPCWGFTKSGVDHRNLNLAILRSTAKHLSGWLLYTDAWMDNNCKGGYM